jgi:hypothetical protein
MSVADPAPRGTWVVADDTATTSSPTAGAPSSPIDLGVVRLFLAIASVPSVQEIRAALASARQHVWVLTDREVPADCRRLYLLERDHLSTPGAFPLDLQIVPIDQVDMGRLPPATVVFERTPA